MKKGLLIYPRLGYNINGEFARRFLEKGGSYGLQIDLALESEIDYGIKDGHFFCSWCGEKISEKYVFVINRTRNHLLAVSLEQNGVRVFNGSEITAVCNDKNLAYIQAVKCKVPCLDTLFATKESLTVERISFPIVLKQPFGHGGENVYLCENEKQLKDTVGNIDGRFLTVQQKLAAKEISDIRVFVVGNKPLYSVKRTAVSSFKANYSQGGDIALYGIDEKLNNYIEKLCAIGYFDFAGFDFLYDGKNYYFNEIEDVVGSKTLCILKDIDTSEIYMEHIKSVLN